MRHKREDVIERTIQEFEHLDRFVETLTTEQWDYLLIRPETKDPWTVKDALAHITHWKANVIRSIRHEKRPPEERGLMINDANHLIYMRWHDRPSKEVLAWHRQVQKELLTILRTVPEEWYSGKEHNADWPFDLVGHSTAHRVRDIERSLAAHSQ